MKISDNKQKHALLLYQAGEAMQVIFDTLQNTGDDYTTAKQRLEESFTPTKNVKFQILSLVKQLNCQMTQSINLLQDCSN